MERYEQVTIIRASELATEVFDALIEAEGHDPMPFIGEVELTSRQAELFSREIFETVCACPTCDGEGFIDDGPHTFACPTCDESGEVSTKVAYSAQTREQAIEEWHEMEYDRSVWG